MEFSECFWSARTPTRNALSNGIASMYQSYELLVSPHYRTPLQAPWTSLVFKIFRTSDVNRGFCVPRWHWHRNIRRTAWFGTICHMTSEFWQSLSRINEQANVKWREAFCSLHETRELRRPKIQTSLFTTSWSIWLHTKLLIRELKLFSVLHLQWSFTVRLFNGVDWSFAVVTE